MARTLSDPRYKTLIRMLKNERVNKGVSQASLAASLGKPQSFVAKVESCERKLDVLEYVAWCQTLSINAPELLKNGILD